MRIVVSGTHASGKSTLIADFAQRHPEFVVLRDPYELLDEAWDAPGTAMFAAQLRLSAERLLDDDLGTHVIAERGPVDFLAYLIALDDLGLAGLERETLARAMEITARSMAAVDLLILLPLTPRDGIHVTDDEYPELREAVDGILSERVDDPDAVGDALTLVTITGDRAARLAALEDAVARAAPIT